MTPMKETETFLNNRNGEQRKQAHNVAIIVRGRPDRDLLL